MSPTKEVRQCGSTAQALLFAGFIVCSHFAPFQPIKDISTTALPEEPCQIEPRLSWTEQEKWAWKQICEGRIADFNKGQDYGGKLDPKTSEDWPKTRVLRPLFLETILLHGPYQRAIPRHGVRIVGAWFVESLDLSNATIPHQLWLDGCRFEASVNFNQLRASLISLLGSKFTRTLSMEGLEVSRLFMSGGAEFAKVDLGIAKVGGLLDMTKSKFTGTLLMDRLQVDGALFMHDGAEFAEVDLRSAKVGNFLAIGSKFTGRLIMNALEVEGSLLMRGPGAEFAEVDLRGAKVGGLLDMTDSKFSGTLAMKRLQVGIDLLMYRVEGAPGSEVYVGYAEIKGNMDIRGSNLPSLDLTGTKIRGEFVLGMPADDPSVKWHQDAVLVLHNTEVGRFIDRRDAWPDKLDLVGFTYDSFGSEIASREVSWFTNWLARQTEYSPQPYQQLAGVLRKAGHADKAKDILYAGKEQERKQATWRQWIWLTALKCFIGYGFRIYYTLWWVLGLIVTGALVLNVTNQGPLNGMPYGFSYSVDMLLPIIELSKRHYEIHLYGFARYYFYFHKVMGWILASFIVAGITGLTEKT